jgi:hypothetical protein
MELSTVTGRPANGMAGRRFLGNVFATLLLAGCAASAGGSPAPTSLDLAAVTSALQGAGITVAEVANNLDPRDGAWRCLPGSFRLARVQQQHPAAVARPGDRPSVDVLLFSSSAERAAAQAKIGTDGRVHVDGCGTMVDWIATPHLVGARNVLLFIATNDPAAWAAVQAAATNIGG